MSRYAAIEKIDEAINLTKKLLWPVRTEVWVRIAIVALFLGGGMISPIRTEYTDGMELFSNFSSYSEVLSLSDYMGIIITVGVVIIVACLIYIIISAIFQFVFVDCLSTGTILLTKTFILRWRKGLQLMGLYLILLTIIFLSAFGLSYLFIAPIISLGVTNPLILLIGILKFLIVLLLILIPVWVLAILIADFVVPIMIIDDCNLYPAAKKTYSVFNGKWMEAGIYIGLKIIMIFISGLILGSIIFALSIPMGFFGAVVTFSSGFIPKMHPGSLIMVLAGAVAMMFISLLLLVPVVTFFRYYSLLVLRTLHPRYDLLPEHEVYR